MNLPTKPWEISSVNSSVGIVPGPAYISNTDRLHSTAIPFPGSGGGGSAMSGGAVPPPLPPRPNSNQVRPIYSAYNRSSMMPYSSPYSSYGYGGGYSPYSQSPYSSYGLGGNSFYGGNRPYYDQGEPSFSQLAEESSASAFQSIESFVSAFGSISMMLESTFHALYSSFRAVVGVADHLGKVKQILSALAIFRFFRWTFRRIMYLIGISKIKPETIESLWSEAAVLNESSDDTNDLFLRADPNKPSSWPILMFLGFIFAGPYLMWKLIKSLNLDGSQQGTSKAWASGESEHFVAEVKFQFDAGSDRELNLKPGQTIRLAPAKFQPNGVRGWALASDGARIGLVPLNYIKVLGKRSPTDAASMSLNGNGRFKESILNASPHVPASKPRVRFDLNPRPPESEIGSEPNSKVEPSSGILIRNEKETPPTPSTSTSTNE